MSEPPENDRPQTSRKPRSEQLPDAIGRKADRRLKAKRERQRSIWFGLGMFGLVGWSVAIPTLVGTAIGAWLDRRFPGQTSWTLTLLITGLVIGCLNAWRWLRNEGEVS